ncbi:MAG TPA: class I adenylate-forming enzyme family protein [Metabacillus sp.]|nr:class I adenylate-forming enzyme family protein [Metabacillus sp.]
MNQKEDQMTLYGLLKRTAIEYGEEEAIYDLMQRVSYSVFLKDVDRIAAGLKAKGIEKGDRIATALPNLYETAIIYFAVAKLGAVLVPFNPKYKKHEVNFILKNSEPKILFATEGFEDNIGYKEVLFLVPEAITVKCKLDGLPSYDELLFNNENEVEEAEIDTKNDVNCILYTSGTTGVPKGVMITHRSVVQSANTIKRQLFCTDKDVFVIAAPFFHIFGMAINLYCAVSSGARMVLQEKFHPQQMLQLIEQEKVTIKQGVPTMFIKVLETESFDQYDLSSLRAGIVGASAISPAKMKEIRERMGINLCQSYGITETVSVTMTPYDDNEINICETVGKPIPGVTLKIVDDQREAVPNGEVGEIAIKSFGIMKGYYKLPEQTATVLDDEGWFYTGDLGKLNDQGYLTFVGRKKEMIIRGGFNIYPQEIEGVLMKHPKIAEAAVVGLPDETLGEIVCAVIILKDGVTSTEEEMKDYLKEQLAIFKLPGKVIFTKDFPVTASGKIQKLKLRDQLAWQMSRPV